MNILYHHARLWLVFTILIAGMAWNESHANENSAVEIQPVLQLAQAEDSENRVDRAREDIIQPEQEAEVRERLERRFQSVQNQEDVVRELEQGMDRFENMPQDRRREIMPPVQRDPGPRNPQNNINRQQRNFMQELAERVEHRLEAMDDLRKRIEGVEQTMHDYFQELSNKINQSLESRDENARQEQLMAEQQQAEMRRHEQDFQQEMQQQREQINRMQTELEEGKRNIEIREQELQRHEQQVQEQENQLQQQQQDMERERNELNRMQQDLQRREEELQRRFQEVENRFRELEERERIVQQQRQEIENAQNEIQRSREQQERERDEQRQHQEMREPEDNNDRVMGPVGGIILILLIILWLWAIQDCLRRGKDDFPSGEPNDKLIWTVVLLLTVFVGAIIYVFLVQGYRKKANKA